jgi:signal transduction histidine kinase
MDNKNKFITLNIIITFKSIYFTYAVYDEYIESQKNKIDAYIENSIKRNKKILTDTLKKIKVEIDEDKEVFKKIHTEYTLKLRKNPQLDLRELKKEILKKYELNNKDIHLFLLNKRYTIIDATYPSDIGFKLWSIIDARIELDKASDGNIHQSKSVSIDLINSEIKSYSYSKINDELYFEMGFINKKVSTLLRNTMLKIKTITNEKSNLYRIEKRLNGDEYYDNILYKRTNKTKEEYLSSKRMYPTNKSTNNPIINANRSEQIVKKHLDDALIIYIPLIKKTNKYLELMGDFVLEIYIDRTDDIKLNKKIKIYFYLFLTFHILFLLIIYYFTKKYYESLVKLNLKLEENEKLINENKSFIRSITEQIKSPLTVIMNNFTFIEKELSDKCNKYTKQINSAINMLNNSYKDLEYINENEQIKYDVEKINLSNFILDRVTFFKTISNTKNKKITYDIEKNISVTINETELERLVDNNISNAIKHSTPASNIHIKLNQINNLAVLSFSSFSEKIQNKEKIFEKNYQEQVNSTKSLGLGLSMVKSICFKYSIKYDIQYIQKQNVFIYKFSSITDPQS